ncbi:MAG TPA: pre-peptidase C-terminal domain-containing protein [Candidatus Caenarcaniphilales bacterium]
MAEVNLSSVFNNTTNRRSDSVGGADPIDTYSFGLVNSNSDVNISLTGMTANADIRLFRDFNRDGIVNGNDRQLGSSVRGSNREESINLSTDVFGVDVGSYVVEVDPVGSASTRYDLKVSASATGDPSLLLPAEREVGALTSRRTFSDSVSDFDTVDTYRFNVTSGRTFNFSSDTTRWPLDAELRLVRDGNGNREVNTGEVLAESASVVGGNEAISQFLSPGTYYLQAHSPFAADYTLTMG